MIRYKEDFNEGPIKLKSYTDYPQEATENAKIALRWVEENGWGSCGTAVGKVRANQLANREAISRDTIARMSAFQRHRQYSDKELGDGCGRLMWLCWGGDAGIEWAQRKLKQIDNAQTNLISLVVFKQSINNSLVVQMKKWRNTANSSNVDKVVYNDETLELIIKFNNKDIYTYSNVPFNVFTNLIEPLALAKTDGENQFGSWYVGKPSVGAGVHQYLEGYSYSMGGSLK
jgi:hypothetical protein